MTGIKCLFGIDLGDSYALHPHIGRVLTDLKKSYVCKYEKVNNAIETWGYPKCGQLGFWSVGDPPPIPKTVNVAT